MNKTIWLLIIIATAVLTIQADAQSLAEILKIQLDNAQADDQFGDSTAIDGGIMAVAAQFASPEPGQLGEVYLYDADPESPTFGLQLFRLAADNSIDVYLFGRSVAMEGGIVAVGARLKNEGDIHGAIFLFDADPQSLTFGALLNTLMANEEEDDRIGVSVAFEQGTLAAGTYSGSPSQGYEGSVYLFDVDPESMNFGMQIDKLIVKDIEPAEEFGHSIAYDQGIVAVGEPGLGPGAVYLLDADAASPTFGELMRELAPSDAVEFSRFGSSIAIDHSVVAVGAESYRAVYLFDRVRASSSFGSQILRIRGGRHLYGASVAIDRGVMAVGAPSRQGSACIYNIDRDSPSFGQELNEVVASDLFNQNAFGRSVTLNQGFLVVGADNGTERTGSVYIYDIDCPVDVNKNYVYDFFDISDFLTLFAQGDLSIDYDGNGELDFFDVSKFLEEFASGCPLEN